MCHLTNLQSTLTVCSHLVVANSLVLLLIVSMCHVVSSVIVIAVLSVCNVQVFHLIHCRCCD